MNAIVGAVEAEDAERVANAKSNHETEREKVRNTNLEGINELRINLENKIEELEKQFDDAHNAYSDSTFDKNKLFRELQQDDKKLTLRIQKRKRKVGGGGRCSAFLSPPQLSCRSRSNFSCAFFHCPFCVDRALAGGAAVLEEED